MNADLAFEIEREMLYGEESDRIRSAVLSTVEGTIEIFIRNGSPEVTDLPLRGVFDSDEPKIDENEYKKMVNTVVSAVKKYDKEINFGYLTFSYMVNKRGNVKVLNLLHKIDILHNNGRKRQRGIQ